MVPDQCREFRQFMQIKELEQLLTASVGMLLIIGTSSTHAQSAEAGNASALAQVEISLSDLQITGAQASLATAQELRGHLA